MSVRKGAIPTALGTVVTGVGATMAAIEIAPMLAAGVIGFGAAHVVLGTIDLVQNRNRKKPDMSGR